MPGKTTASENGTETDGATKKTPSKPSKDASAGASGPMDILETLISSYGKLEGNEYTDSLDLILFSHLVLNMPLQEACRAYQRFKTQFVDWNEVRISGAKEVQEVVRAADDALELALFLKEFLNRLFTEHHHIGIEFLREMSLSEVRSFFKRSAGFGESTVHLLLVHHKDYPVLPLESWMQPCVERLGWAKPNTTSLQKQKDLHEGIPAEHIELVHFYLAELARQSCRMDDANVDCANCVVQSVCPTGIKKVKRKKATKKAETKKTDAKKAVKKATKSAKKKTTKKSK